MESLDTSCGLGRWRPKFLQRLANFKIYVLVYFAVGCIQGMAFSYLSVVLSTIEKRFGLQSKEAAWLYSGNEISQICFIFVLPFVPLIKRRTLYLGLAMIAASLGAFLIASPHFTASQHFISVTNVNDSSSNDLCISKKQIEDSFCNEDEGVKDYASLVTIFLGIFAIGIGTSFYYSFGVPYVDDNIEKTSSPLILSIISASRTLGPAIGYAVGASALSVWVNPGEDPDFGREDPRWIGAWWVGFIVVGALLLITGPIFVLFPRRLPGNKITDAKDIAKIQDDAKAPENPKEWLNELIGVGKRLFSNKTWIANTLSTMFFLFAFIGFATFIPKYLEYHFRKSASAGGGFGGMSKTISAVIGLILSGWLISKYKFGAKTLAGLCVFGTFTATVTFVILTLLACPKLTIKGLEADSCASAQCECNEESYHPVCYGGYINFFSPCHAGCSGVNRSMEVNNNKKTYWNCYCAQLEGLDTLSAPLGSALGGPGSPGDATVVDGYCPEDCDSMFYAMLGLLAIATMISSATRVPNMIISLRIIEKRDKAASLTINVSFLSLAAFLPAPFVFGSIFDSTCAIWGRKCDHDTNCLVYDTDAMRVNLGSLAAALCFCALLCDLGVWYFIPKDLDMYGDVQDSEEDDDKDETSKNSKHDSGIYLGDGMVEIELHERDM